MKDLHIDNTTIDHLNIKCFMGRWYEIARYEHYFERGMTHVNADYSLLPDGEIRVVNRGMKNGRPKEIVGRGTQPDPIRHPGKLKISFFLWFYSDYYILELDKKRGIAVIGSSAKRYLWILSRTPEISNELKEEFLEKIRLRGYDLSKLVFVQQ